MELPQPPHQILGPPMRVPPEHLQGLVARNRRDLHRIQAILKEPGGRLMPQVVEGQASMSRGFPAPPQALLKGMG